MQETFYSVRIVKDGEESFSSDQMTDQEVQTKMSEIFGDSVLGFLAMWYAAKKQGGGVANSLSTKCNLYSDDGAQNLYEIEVKKA